MIQRIITAVILTIGIIIGASAQTPRWLESDASTAIASRIRADFPFTVEQFKTLAASHDASLTSEVIDEMILNKYVETMVIDDTVRVFRKALRNLNLLDPSRNGKQIHRGDDAREVDISYVDSVIDWTTGANPYGGAHRVEYAFIIEIPGHEALAGDTVRAWMPVPITSARQRDVAITYTSQPEYILSTGRSVHNTIYFEAPAPAIGDTLRLEYRGSFVTTGQFFSEEYILEHLQPYDTTSETYRRYTDTEAPHIVRLPALANAIAGTETNPYRLSERVFDFISHILWAGAREYSTINCIPTYVLEQGHGDCGQVALLYISLMRTLGIPARWESGWMLHPGDKNFHDWAEVYFEGVGWVPVDPSFSNYNLAPRAESRGFYGHGMDSHRFASNTGVCGELYPAKQYVRSETVDFQAGEVETSRGNLFYPGWKSTLKLINVTPVKLEP